MKGKVIKTIVRREETPWLKVSLDLDLMKTTLERVSKLFKLVGR